MKIDPKTSHECERTRKTIYKRPRKCAFEVDRKHMCPYCSKSYGNSSSRNLHIKLKHPEVYSDLEESHEPQNQKFYSPTTPVHNSWSMRLTRQSSGTRSVVPHIESPKGMGSRRGSGGNGMRNVLNKTSWPEKKFLDSPTNVFSDFSYSKPVVHQQLHPSGLQVAIDDMSSSFSYSWALLQEKTMQFNPNFDMANAPLSCDSLDVLLRLGPFVGDDSDIEDSTTVQDTFGNVPFRFSDYNYSGLISNNIAGRRDAS